MTNHALATVIAKDGMTADSLATVMTITERKKAFAIAKNWSAAARVVRLENGRPVVEASGKFRRLMKD
jgi:thiamine biosynthesis lipoprotein ApbE